MKRHWHLALGALMLALFTANAADDSPSNDALLKIVASREGLKRITTNPVSMEEKAAMVCLPPPKAAIEAFRVRVANIHPPKAFIHVYATTNAVATLKGTNDSVQFPLGTIVLKQKLAARDSQETVIYTGMLKREKGYNPDCGDWEFFTVSGDAKKMTSRGRLESCMDCHRNYFRNDFVTGYYR